MRLQFIFSTPCPDVARLGGWQPTVMSVEFLFGGSYGSTGERRNAIENYLIHARDLRGVDAKLTQASGRYRKTLTVPI